MSDVVIHAEGLGKRYLIGHEAQQERYTALRDVLARTAKGIARSALDMVRGRQLVAGDEVEEFWALKDVDFEIQRGEVVGIIGRNGAGKSTLLKILSRITEPSAGRVEIKGRVASLLEVGTGFHPELTGRENIYLNGAILGMSRAEIKREFDEIVAFAEIEKFLDTPVKRYSSGMYVRLAFAVAAHLEPEILVVDEVLAVGDAEFQKKCLGKMQDVAGHGRTVLFVSHNMGAVLNLCNKAVLLKNGQISSQGEVTSIVATYNSRETASAFEGHARKRPGRAGIDGAAVEVTDLNGVPALRFRFSLWSEIKARLALELPINDVNCQPVAFASYGALSSAETIEFEGGRSQVELLVDASPLANGQYRVSVMLSIPDIEFLDKIEDCLDFSIDAKPNPNFERRLEQRWRFGSVSLATISARIPCVVEQE